MKRDGNHYLPFLSPELLASVDTMLQIAPFGTRERMHGRCIGKVDSLQEGIRFCLAIHSDPEQRNTLMQTWKERLRAQHLCRLGSALPPAGDADGGASGPAEGHYMF